MKQTTALLLFLLGVFSLEVDAQAQINQQTRINSSPNPIGSGARAQGMGGAFIAIADDATAASWNPGGLIPRNLLLRRTVSMRSHGFAVIGGKHHNGIFHETGLLQTG